MSIINACQKYCNRSKIFVEPVFDRVENIVEKGENASSPHFLISSQCFLPCL